MNETRKGLMAIENIVKEPAVTVDLHQDSMEKKNEAVQGKETEEETVNPGILWALNTNNSGMLYSVRVYE